MQQGISTPISISVIVASRSGGQALAGCLAGLDGVQTPDGTHAPSGAFEAIVVLSAAAAETGEQLAAAYPAWPLRTCLLDSWETAAAFNRGAELAQGQICL